MLAKDTEWLSPVLLFHFFWVKKLSLYWIMTLSKQNKAIFTKISTAASV